MLNVDAKAVLGHGSPIARLVRVMAMSWFFVSFGCSGGDTGVAPSIETVLVKGTLSAGGKPVQGGILTLEPVVDGGSVTQAVGEVKAGAFELVSAGGQPGATPGKYRVKLEAEPTSYSPRASAKTKLKNEVLVEVVEGQALDIQLP